MSSPYTPVPIVGYNVSPPTDDGTRLSDNQLRWATHISKIGDPLNTALLAVDQNVTTAFQAIYGQTAEEAAATIVPTFYQYLPGDVRRYGATGDGTTDDTTAIQTALNTGHNVFLPPLTFRIDSPLLLTDATVKIVGYGAVLDFSNNSTAAAVALKIEGSESATTTTLTANSNQGDATLTVASIAGFLADDWASVTSDTELLGTEATYVKGELVKIASAAASTLTLYSGVKTSYDQGAPTVTITKFNMIERPEIHGIKIIGSGVIADDHVGIQISYAVAPLIKDVSVIDCASTGIDLNRCTHGLVQGCYTENNNDNVGATGYGYSMSPLSQFCVVDSCRAKRFKHAFTTGGLLPVWNWVVSNCAFSNQISTFTTYMVDPHANGVNGLFMGNTVEYGYAGVRCRGPRNAIVGNTITNIYNNQCIELALDGPQEGLIEGNRCEGLNGIKITDDTGVTTFSTSVIGNHLFGVAVDGGTIGIGILATGPNTVIQGNTIRNHSPGIRNDGDNNTIKSNTILDTINTTFAYGIYMLDGDDVSIMGNTISCPNSTTMTRCILLAANATRTRIMHNDLRDATNTTIDDSGTGTIIIDNVDDGVLRNEATAFKVATTTELEDITDVINTSPLKIDGFCVWNTTTNQPVWSISNTDGAVWADATGATAHTPV